jgi:DNA polymerase III delta subunit
MKNTPKKIKNLKISESTHQVLKTYCEDNGLKIYKYLEKLILENCKKKKDIYGEN